MNLINNIKQYFNILKIKNELRSFRVITGRPDEVIKNGDNEFFLSKVLLLSDEIFQLFLDNANHKSFSLKDDLSENDIVWRYEQIANFITLLKSNNEFIVDFVKNNVLNFTENKININSKIVLFDFILENILENNKSVTLDLLFDFVCSSNSNRMSSKYNFEHVFLVKLIFIDLLLRNDFKFKDNDINKIIESLNVDRQNYSSVFLINNHSTQIYQNIVYVISELSFKMNEKIQLVHFYRNYLLNSEAENENEISDLTNSNCDVLKDITKFLMLDKEIISFNQILLNKDKNSCSIENGELIIYALKFKKIELYIIPNRLKELTYVEIMKIVDFAIKLRVLFKEKFNIFFLDNNEKIEINMDDLLNDELDYENIVLSYEYMNLFCQLFNHRMKSGARIKQQCDEENNDCLDCEYVLLSKNKDETNIEALFVDKETINKTELND